MSVNDILPTAVRGLERQAARVEQSAERIARFSTGLPKPGKEGWSAAGPSDARSSDAEQPGAGSPGAGSRATGAPQAQPGSTLLAAQEAGEAPPPATEEGLVVDLVTLRQASLAYKANLAVFETGMELAEEVLKLAKPKG